MRIQGSGDRGNVLSFLEREAGRMAWHLRFLALGWTFAIGISLFWNLVQLRRGTEESARTEARTAFNRDVLYRRWNAMSGGVYAPVTEETPPNPYLENDERDIETPSGRKLTLVNPAYMTRRAHELGARYEGILGHITALDPIRPENAADPWETRALEALERGEKEVTGVEVLNGVPHMRLIRPLVTEEKCLECHEAQGYRLGDIRGGISVAIPMAPLRAIGRRSSLVLIVAHALLWVAGCAAIGARMLQLRVDMRRRWEEAQERVALASELRQSQKRESLGTLAGGVAHEINNPINGIMNYAQLLLDRTEQDDPRREYASGIIGEADRVAGVVRSLLYFAREGRGVPSDERMCDMVGQTVALVDSVMRHDQIALSVDVPEALPVVSCRRQQIQQVLLNLLTNARDSLNAKYPGHDNNKRICIHAKELTDTGDAFVRLTVEDSGEGMGEDTQLRVFDPFFTTKGRSVGSGLGLSVSYGIVKEHGGRMSVETEQGRYARFHVDLPVSGPS
jgi:signal transduction histidine kinase